VRAGGRATCDSSTTLWHAYNIDETRWIARDHFTLHASRSNPSNVCSPNWTTALPRRTHSAGKRLAVRSTNHVVSISRTADTGIALENPTPTGATASATVSSAAKATGPKVSDLTPDSPTAYVRA